MMRAIHTRTALLTALLWSSCQDSSFKGGIAQPPVETPEPAIPPAPAVDEALSKTETPAPVEEAGSLTDKFSISLKADVVFAVDSSASMGDELIAVQNNLGKMLTALTSGKLDPRVHLLLDATLTLPAGIDPQKVAFVRQRVDSTDAIANLNNLFAGLYAASYFGIDNKPLAAPLNFRKDAKLEVVVISDDNGAGDGNLAADFDSKGMKATFSGIIGLPTSVDNDVCQVANVGGEYIMLAMQTGGSALDICSADWSALITRLSNDIVKRSVTFSLSQKPRDPKKILVQLDKQKMLAQDWTYDAKNNALTLVTTKDVKDGSALTVNYNPG